MEQSDPKPIEQPEGGPPFQFGLRTLFVITFLWAVVCAIGVQFGVGGVIFSTVLGLLAVGVWHRPTRKAAVLTGMLLLLGVSLSHLLPHVGSRAAARRAVCRFNLKQIDLALHNYHEIHGCFPPAYIADKSGRPMHSWRVLILPLVEQEELYKQYRFDEPWDGPHNRRWIDTGVSEFRCPADELNESLMTNYVAVVGPGTAWPGRESSKMSDFGDGLSNTILLVEVANSGIHWAEPRDLHVGQMAPGINPKAGQGISSKHTVVVNVLFADGTVRALPVETLPETIRALLSPHGGEKVDLD